MKKNVLAVLAAITIPVSANAACIDEIREIFEIRSTQSNVRALIETEMNGQVVQTTNGWYLDYRHNMFEVVGRNWWSMTAGDTHYNSTDGKTWTKSGSQDPDWEEKAAQARESILSTMTDTECGATEEIDGTSYRVYRYSHEAEKPFPTKTDNVLYFDPEQKFLFRTVVHNKLQSPATITTTYTRDEAIDFPQVE